MLKVKVKTDNDAFAEDNGGPGEECARIMRRIADSLDEGYTSGLCVDANGNTVGSWEVTQ